MEKFIKKYVTRDEKYFKRGFHRYRDWYGDVVYVKEVCDGTKSFGWIVCDKDGKAIHYRNGRKAFMWPRWAAQDYFVKTFKNKQKKQREDFEYFVKQTKFF